MKTYKAKGMNVSICSRSELKKLIYTDFPSDTAIISYYGIDEKRMYIPDLIRNVSLCIDDEKDYSALDTNDYHAEDFKRVANYILNCYENRINIICQCEAGISRSAATAAAVLQFLEQKGMLVFSDYELEPNKLFYNGIYHYLNDICLKRISTFSGSSMSNKYEMPCLDFLITKLKTSEIKREQIFLLYELHRIYKLPAQVTNALIEHALSVCDNHLFRKYIIPIAVDMSNHRIYTYEESLKFLKRGNDEQ